MKVRNKEKQRARLCHSHIDTYFLIILATDAHSLSHEATHVLNRAIVGLRKVLACETFNPIYTTFVHEAFCVEGVSGLTYIFSTTLVISIFSMVMIMFRAALYPIKEPYVQPVSRSEDTIEVVEYSKNSPGEEHAEVERALAEVERALV